MGQEKGGCWGYLPVVPVEKEPVDPFQLIFAELVVVFVLVG